MNALLLLTRALCIGLSSFLLSAGATHAVPGDLESTFGIDGTRYPAGTVGQSSPMQQLAVAGNGAIYVAGDCNGSLGASVCVRKFTASGALDTTFGVSGYHALVVGEFTFLGVLGMALAPGSTDITLAGTCAITRTLTGGGATTVGTCIVRFNAAGGMLRHFYGGTEEAYFDRNISTAFAQLPSGVLALAGFCASGDSTFCTRIVSDVGLPLNSYVSLRSPGDYARVGAIATTASGGLWIVTTCKDGAAFAVCVVKFTAYNVLDTTFGNTTSSSTRIMLEAAGVPATTAPVLTRATAVATQPDGKLIIAGSCRSNGVYRCVKRYLADGSIDTTWAAGSATPNTLLFGRANESTVAPVLSVQDTLAVLGDGKIVYGTGLLQPPTLTPVHPPRSDVVVHRLRHDGSVDPLFGNNASGKAILEAWDASGTRINSAHSALSLTRDDALIVLGICKAELGAAPIEQPCLAKLKGGPLDYARCSADIDGDGVITTNDSLLLSRVALGFRDATLAQGVAFTVDATRNTWPKIRDFLFNQCGMAVSP